MRKIVRRLVEILELVGLAAFGTFLFAAVVALWHILETPQPLESILPGEAGIYRWRQGHIFYKTLGDKDAPPLVLLHAPALGASAYEMRKIIGALAQQYHVYALDLLGFGLSDHPHIDYSAETYIALCHDFLTRVVAQPAMVLANGLSCNYAVIVARRFPETCTRLVLISPFELSGGTQASRLLSALMQPPVFRFFLYPLLSTRFALRYRLARKRAPHQGQVSISDVDYFYATTHQFGAEHAPLARMAGHLATNAAESFDTLQQPTLVLWGARALNNVRLITNQQHLPTSTEIALIQDGGIAVHEEYPAQVVANILRWTEVGTPQATAQKGSGVPVNASLVEMEEPAARQEEAAEKEVMAYCVKCKKKTPMQNPHEVTMKNGSPAVRATCSICGTGQHRIGRL